MRTVAGIQYPTPLHRRVLSAILADARVDPGVRGLLLTGSLARGTARADSDLDVLVVISEQATDDGWRSAAFLDAVVLHDPEGTAARLIADAAGIHKHYEVPAPVKAHYTRLWHHVRPKMLADLSHGDPTEIGWASAVMTNDVLRTAWAASGLPNPSLDLGTVQRHLDDLTIPADAPAQIRAILRAPPRESLQRQLDLIAAILPYLEESR
jgi:predicted nucleotidyltransferase